MKNLLLINTKPFPFRQSVAGVTTAFAALMVGAVIPASSALAAQGQSAPAAPAQGQFGFIDQGKLRENSKVRKQADAELQQLQKASVAVMDRLVNGSARYLVTAEINELGGLYQKEKPTEAEQKRISELVAKGEQVQKEMTDLQNTPTPTAAQTTRLTALTEARTKGEDALKALDNDLAKRLQDKLRDSEAKAVAQEKEVIAKIAKEKKIGVVFATDVAFYVTTDITDDVLKEINK